MSNSDEVHLLSGAYAVDAVTAEEAALVEAAMKESEDLHSEVVGLSDTAVALGMAVPEEAPPAALRSRLMVAIDSLPQLPGDDAPTPTTIPAGEHVARRRRRRLRPMALLSVAAAAVLLFGGGFLVQRTLLEPQSQYNQITLAEDAQHASAHIRAGGALAVYWSKSEHATAISLTGVSVPDGKVLQLWSVRGGTVTSAGLYQPQAGDRFVLITGTPTAGESLAVSVEPDGGSTQPTTRPIVSVPLRA